MPKRRAPTLEDCKAALRRRRKVYVGDPPIDRTPQQVPARLLAWAVREIERLREPDIAMPPKRKHA